MKNIPISFIDEVDNQKFHLKPVGFYFDGCFDRNIRGILQILASKILGIFADFFYLIWLKEIDH